MHTDHTHANLHRAFRDTQDVGYISYCVIVTNKAGLPEKLNFYEKVFVLAFRRDSH